jgi:hypothetical protein
MALVLIPNFNTEKVVSGLNTYQYTVQSAAVHNCRIKVDKMPPSTMTISIVQAGSHSGTLATVTLVPVPGSDGQTSQILQAPANCQPGDTLSFVLSSSASIDEQLNTVKATLNIHIGGLS